ncbi:MAG: VWA domain-containing protein [Polyangiaceae bacterium]|nr:VWA domain-containing protein [Polyangiaceae bacterium]
MEAERREKEAELERLWNSKLQQKTIVKAKDDGEREPLLDQIKERARRRIDSKASSALKAASDVPPAFNTESYAPIDENPFIDVATDPRSTFSIDVDTASYSIMRRYIERSQRPPKGAVRIEELINYFPYDDAVPVGDAPFAVRTDVTSAPWTPANRLVRISLKGKSIDRASRAGTNLVFLIDVSGSMESANKLPLLKRSLGLLVNQLDARDRVSIVVYAGASGLVLPPTSGADKRTIMNALDNLNAGGSTNGGEGIELAYAQATRNFIEGGTNRVILATDGDFNVGVTDRSSLVDLIAQKAKSGVFLSVLGFGMGNYKDDTLESLAQRGNGNYAYVDDMSEARKVLVEQVMGTLVTIAKDVKIQVEWNPRLVQSFRLIGYENRMLAHRDFNDDRKDAGDIGAGHSVTALYEVVIAGAKQDKPGTDPLKYQSPGQVTDAGQSNELVTVKLRYKEPNGATSRLLEVTAIDKGKTFAEASTDFRFAASVAAFGMILRSSPHKGNATMSQVVSLAEGSLGEDPGGHRRAFVELVRAAAKLPERSNGERDTQVRSPSRCDPADPLCTDL